MCALGTFESGQSRAAGGIKSLNFRGPIRDASRSSCSDINLSVLLGLSFLKT